MTIELARETAVQDGPSRSQSNDDITNSAGHIGPALNGYKRPPALLAQVVSLNAYPNSDYLFASSAGDWTALKVYHPEMRATFRSIRNTAFTTGDPESITVLCQFILKAAELLNLEPRATVMAQLNREFGFDVGPSVQRLDEITSGDPFGRTQLQIETQAFQGGVKGAVREHIARSS
jgi:hypothetical protein